MLRSLFSGVSGMRSHQMRMDVIGNNIANVNTTGFKSSRANFQDMLYQKVKSGGNGRNPAFVGTGVNIAGISTNFTNGALQNTGRTLDLAIQGDGFFAVSNDSDLSRGNIAFDPDSHKVNFTRDGVFFIDKDGFLVNSDGYKLIGYDGTKNRPIQIYLEYKDSSDNTVNLTVESINISPDGTITGKYTNGNDIKFNVSNDYNNEQTTSIKIAVATFKNNEGLLKVGSNLFAEDSSVSGSAVYGVPSDTISIASGYLEMSNVDLSDEFANMITTQRGFQANARVITVSDTLLEELIQLKR